MNFSYFLSQFRFNIDYFKYVYMIASSDELSWSGLFNSNAHDSYDDLRRGFEGGYGRDLFELNSVAFSLNSKKSFMYIYKAVILRTKRKFFTFWLPFSLGFG